MRTVAFIGLLTLLSVGGCAKDRDAAVENYWSRRESRLPPPPAPSLRNLLKSPQATTMRDRGYPNNAPIPELDGRR